MCVQVIVVGDSHVSTNPAFRSTRDDDDGDRLNRTR